MQDKAAINFGKAAREYAKYLAGFPESFFARLTSERVEKFDCDLAALLKKVSLKNSY